MPSRDDVARLAGVSGATVSYVLNGTSSQTISPKTRARVLKAAAKLNYQPSHAARAMVRGRYDQIGLLVPPDDLTEHWYHMGIMQGVWREVTQYGIRLVIDTVLPGRTLSFVEERFVDGLIAPGTGPDTLTEAIRDRLAKLQLPVVVIGSGSWCEDFHTVDVDNVEVGRVATEQVLALGHRKLMYFGGLSGVAGAGAVRSVQRRREGYRAALAAVGLKAREDLIVDAHYELEKARDAARTLLQRQPDATAAVCYNDATAIALWHAAKDLGIRVPEDLALIGVDANPHVHVDRYTLASVRQPLIDMGRKAVELIRTPPESPAHILCPVELQTGDSLGPAPALA